MRCIVTYYDTHTYIYNMQKYTYIFIYNSHRTVNAIVDFICLMPSKTVAESYYAIFVLCYK